MGTESITSPSVQDWSGIVSFMPRLYFKPTDMEELKSALTAIISGGFKPGRLRIMGSMHSCSRIHEADAIVDMSGMPPTLEADEDNFKVTVSANWQLRDFLREASKLRDKGVQSGPGRCLTATGGTDEQTLAGLISTNTAPATSKSTVYETVEWLEYLTVSQDGKNVELKKALRGQPEFQAAICSLGAIGVLTKVGLRLVKERFYKTTHEITSMTDVLSDLNATSQKYDFWRVNWLPKSKKGLLWAATEIPYDAGKKMGDSFYPSDGSENTLVAITKHLDKLKGSAGIVCDGILFEVYKSLASSYKPQSYEGPMRNMLPVDRRAPVRAAMAEWSFSPKDLDQVLAKCEEYFSQAGWPSLPTELELTKTDNYFMSPWNWENLDYIVKLNFMYFTNSLTKVGEVKAIHAHLQGLWEHLVAAKIPFKAHWGKINFLTPEFVEQNYKLKDFKPYIRPMFVNNYLAERLGYNL